MARKSGDLNAGRKTRAKARTAATGKKAKKKAAVMPLGRASVMEVEPSAALTKPALGGGKQAAVIGCVNGALDTNRPGWNADGSGNGRTMDKDLHYDVHSVPAFLGVVSRCLSPTYTLTIDTPLVQSCVSATVATVKQLVFKKTAQS
jgi:hypothetical protein